MNAPLSQSVIIYNELRDRLASEFDLEDDDQALLDTLDGLQDLKERLIWMAREAERSEQFAEAIKAIIADNQERRKRFEVRSEKLRKMIAWAMQETGMKKIDDCPDMTISLRQNPPSLVTTIEPEDAPIDYRKAKVTYTFDKTKIKAALDGGADLDWAHLNNGGQSVTIRTR
jgi:hypothetical protein